MLALPDALGQMANRVVDRVVILVKATLPVSWSMCRIVADRLWSRRCCSGCRPTRSGSQIVSAMKLDATWSFVEAGVSFIDRLVLESFR